MATSSATSITIPIKKLTQAEMVAQREKGLYYNCHDKFVPCYKCRKQILFLLDQMELEEEDTNMDETEEKDAADELPGVEAQTISIHALLGTLVVKPVLFATWFLFWIGLHPD